MKYSIALLFLWVVFTPPLRAFEALTLNVEILNVVSEDDGSTRIPLKRAGNLFFIEAEVDGTQGNFILDLGAPYLVLNSTYFRDHEVEKNVYAGTLLTGENQVRKKNIKKFDFHEVEYKWLTADILDLGVIENKRGAKILGLMGVRLFERYVLELDLKNQQIILLNSLDNADERGEKVIETRIRRVNGVILVEGSSNGVNLNLILDSGAESNILDNKLSPEIYEDMYIQKASSVTDGKGRETEVILAVMQELSISGEDLGSMQTVIMNLSPMSRAYGSKIDGMLGYPFFAKGRVLIDFKSRKLIMYRSKPVLN